MRSAGDSLPHALVHDLGREILGPAVGAKVVAALQPRHSRCRNRNQTNFAQNLPADGACAADKG